MAWKQIAYTEDLTTHTGNTANPHSVTKAQVGLGNCDNTSDANKPVSTATQAAIDALDYGDLKADGSVSLTGDLNFDQNQGVAFVAENLASAPASPVAGQIYFNTGDGALYVNV
jgi:hypothetical protein